MTEVLLPIRTWSEPNLRGHWARRARRAREAREAARLLVRAALAPLPPGTGGRKIIVRLTRIGPRRLDSDNLAAALKHVRDGVADALGMDDGDARLRWLYAQRNGRPGEYAVLVEIS
ncbi:MAG TPA: endodeoxyribonuclease RusA [Planctomycetota bacterium]|jgi:crossover junction endodeoxyribonuclease RusA|nr:endodeoxyribonuclease RusA [Planctomycetota bacterium]